MISVSLFYYTRKTFWWNAIRHVIGQTPNPRSHGQFISRRILGRNNPRYLEARNTHHTKSIQRKGWCLWQWQLVCVLYFRHHHSPKWIYPSSVCPLPEPLLTHIYVALWRHCATKWYSTIILVQYSMYVSWKQLLFPSCTCVPRKSPYSSSSREASD